MNANVILFVDIFFKIQAVISQFKKLGKATVDSYYPFDHTHTNTEGANQVARAFLNGLKCSAAQGALAEYVLSVKADASTSCK